MLIRVLVVATAAVGAALGTGADPENAPGYRAYPSLVIFRGGGLASPIGLQHCCSTEETTRTGLVVANVIRDTLALLYGQDLVPATEAQIAALKDSAWFEVAEYMGEWPLETAKAFTGNVATLRGPALPRLFEGARHFSWIYRAHGTEPAIWENPSVSPVANVRYYVIDAKTEKVLANIGVKVRE